MRLTDVASEFVSRNDKRKHNFGAFTDADLLHIRSTQRTAPQKKPLFTLLFPGWLCLFLSFFLAGRLILTRIRWDFVSTKSIMSAAGWLKRNNSFLARASVTLVSCSIIYAFSSTLGFNKVKQKHTL